MDKYFVCLVQFILSFSMPNSANETESAVWIQQTPIDLGAPIKSFNSAINDHDKIVACKVSIEAINRKTKAKYDIFDENGPFDGNLCTHLIYGPLFVNNSYQLEYSNYAAELAQISNISTRYPHLKILLETAVHKNADKVFKLTELATTIEDNHFYVVENLKTVVQKYGFDGIFLEKSFHFTTQASYRYQDYLKNIAPCMKETFSQYLNDEFRKDGLLTAAEIEMYPKKIAHKTYGSLQTYVTRMTGGRVSEMSQIFDFVVVNGYKLLYREMGQAHHNAPLYPVDKGDFNIYERLEEAFVDWASIPGKMVLGVPFFGFPYLISEFDSLFGFKSLVDPYGFSGSFLQRKDYWGYNEICYSTILNKNVWKMYWDEKARVPFLKKGNHWITFDNWKSINEKVTLAMQLGMQGIMAHTIDTDDFLGMCAQIKNPLLKTINYAVKNSMLQQNLARCNLSSNSSNFTASPLIWTDFFILPVALNSVVQINCTAEASLNMDLKLVNGKNETVTENYVEYSDLSSCVLKKRKTTKLIVKPSVLGKYSCVANTSAGYNKRDFFLMSKEWPYIVVENEVWIRKIQLDFRIPEINNSIIDVDQVLICKINRQSGQNETNENHYDFEQISDLFGQKLCNMFIYGPFFVNHKYEVLNEDKEDLEAIRNLTEKHSGIKIQIAITVSRFHNLLQTQELLQLKQNFKNLIRYYGFSGVHFDSSIFLDADEKSFNRERNLASIAYTIQNVFQNEQLLATTEIEIYSKNILKLVHEDLFYKMTLAFNFVILKAYDFTKSIPSDSTGHNSPLSSLEKPNDNIIENLEHLLKRGGANTYSSLVLGIPLFGYKYILQNSKSYTFGFNSTAAFPKNKLRFNEICSTVLADKKKWEMYWDNEARVPFLKNDRQWITFDNPKSIYEKFTFYLTLVNKFKLRGIVVDSVDQDDFLGVCTNVTYPLLQTIYDCLKKPQMLVKLNASENNNNAFVHWWWVAITIIGIIFISLTIAGGQYLVYKKNKKSHGLTSKEIEGFIEGNVDVVQSGTEFERNPDGLPYDTSYEIPEESYQLDTGALLGSGAFGIVYKGMANNVPVAVKTTKPGADKQYLKSLLSELKILIYIEKHPNIVNLIGADTTKLKTGRVFVFVELCPFGSLQDYLRSSRENFKSLFVGNDMQYNNWEAEKILNRNTDSEDVAKTNFLTTEHLIIWCLQISKALQHLNLKKIIHGDLAVRNILVFDKYLVKVTDFGLSRKLYNYSDYVKKNQEPLPWRWMAFESLRDLTFSNQSDVWSFGVTMWEVFSLAETPYPGLSWTPEFVQFLKQNLRMQKPIHATNELYDFMLECWRLNPQDRPKPNDLPNFFEKMITTLQFKKYSRNTDSTLSEVKCSNNHQEASEANC